MRDKDFSKAYTAKRDSNVGTNTAATGLTESNKNRLFGRINKLLADYN